MPSAPLVAPAVSPGAGAPAAPATPSIEGKVAANDTLGKLLKHHGLTAAETDEVIRSLSGVLDFKNDQARASRSGSSVARMVAYSVSSSPWRRATKFTPTGNRPAN